MYVNVTVPMVILTHMNKKCLACPQKVSKGKYCQYHNEALCHLKSHYKLWIKAYNRTISWDNFLNKLFQMDETGVWVKEVILIELNKIYRK